MRGAGRCEGRGGARLVGVRLGATEVPRGTGWARKDSQRLGALARLGHDSTGAVGGGGLGLTDVEWAVVLIVASGGGSIPEKSRDMKWSCYCQ